MSRAAHAALLRQPWQLRRHSRRWPLIAATPLLLMLLPLAVAGLRGLSLAATLAAMGLVLLTWLWWMQVDGLLQQNRAALARLVPGHAAALRQSLLAQALPVATAAVLLLTPALDSPLRALWLVLPVMVILAWLSREPWLWLVFGVLSPLLGELNGSSLAMAQQPLALQVLAAAALVLLLALCVGQGGPVHRWADAQQRRWQRSLRAASEGRPAPTTALGPLTGALQRLFDWPLRLWRRRLLAAAGRAPWAARLELGLDTGGRGWQVLWTGLVIAIAAVAVLQGLSPRHGLTVPLLVDHARVGLGIGLYAMLAGMLHGRLAQLWARRREQALLVLLPGLPEGGEVAGLERRWRRQWLAAWLGATTLALAVGALGSPGTVDYLAVCAAASLPLVWLAQAQQRRLRSAPRLIGLTLVPPAAAVLAYGAQQLAVPAGASLALGGLAYAALAWRSRGGALRLPVARTGGST